MAVIRNLQTAQEQYDYEQERKLREQEPSRRLIDFAEAGELMEQGYIRISNRHRIVARPDREDWPHVLAEKMNCCVANFYQLDGSGLCPRWREHYTRTDSADRKKISRAVYNLMKP